MRRLIALVSALVLGLGLAGAAFAVDGQLTHTGRVLVSVGGDITLPAGEQADVLVVVNGNAVVEGMVNTIVVEGTATLRGAMTETLFVANGRAESREPGMTAIAGLLGLVVPPLLAVLAIVTPIGIAARVRAADRRVADAGLRRLHRRRTVDRPVAAGSPCSSGAAGASIWRHHDRAADHVRARLCAALHVRRVVLRNGRGAARDLADAARRRTAAGCAAGAAGTRRRLTHRGASDVRSLPEHGRRFRDADPDRARADRACPHSFRLPVTGPTQDRGWPRMAVRDVAVVAGEQCRPPSLRWRSSSTPGSCSVWRSMRCCSTSCSPSGGVHSPQRRRASPNVTAAATA